MKKKKQLKDCNTSNVMFRTQTKQTGCERGFVQNGQVRDFQVFFSSSSFFLKS